MSSTRDGRMRAPVSAAYQNPGNVAGERHDRNSKLHHHHVRLSEDQRSESSLNAPNGRNPVT